MSDKTIQSLTPADPLVGTELFVLQQNGAKKIEAQTFIAYLTDALSGHGGISNISYTPPASVSSVDPSLNGTLTVTTADGTPFPFDITNGRGISNITWTTSGTAGDGMIHTGTILYNDGSTSPVQFQDGVQGPAGTQTQVWIKYADDYPTADSQMHTEAGPVIGIYTGTAPTPPTSYTAYTWYEFKGEQGDTGDYIENVLSYGNSSAAGIEPSTWYGSPTSISYAAGNYIWRKTEYVMHGTQTVQATKKEIIGYIGQNGSGSGTVTQITFNGTVFQDNGAGNVNMTVDADDVGAIANPQNKSNGQVLTYDSVAEEWVAATPSTGSVNTVNNVGPTAGTTNVQLYATAIPMSSTDDTSVANSIPQASNVLPSSLGTASAGSGAGFSRPDHVHPMPSASDVGAVSTSEVQYKVYDSVTDLGLTSGSATISGAWTALRAIAPALLVCGANQFGSNQTPRGNTYGTVVMAVADSTDSSAHGFVEFHSYSESLGNFYQPLSSYSPSGTWVRETGPTLLWTNSSQSSDFAGQTVSISLYAFTHILVEFKASKSYSTRTPLMEIEINEATTYCQIFYNAAGSGASSLLNRSVTASSTGVVFGDCTSKATTSTSAATTDNSKMIPVKIYGV